jgi:hypothetical protein
MVDVPLVAAPAPDSPTSCPVPELPFEMLAGLPRRQPTEARECGGTCRGSNRLMRDRILFRSLTWGRSRTDLRPTLLVIHAWEWRGWPQQSVELRQVQRSGNLPIYRR